MSAKVLFVDDDDNIRAAVHRTFKNRYDLDLASGGAQGLRAMEEHGPYAVVVADLAMPGMNGITFLQKAQDLAPDTVRIMFTGHPGPLALMEAINSGQVFRFVTKPCQLDALAAAVDAGVRQYRLVSAEQELLEATLTGGIGAMMGLLETLDPVAYSEAKILADRAGMVAEALKIQETWAITLAALYSPLWILPLPGEVRRKMAAGTLLEPQDTQVLATALGRAADLVQGIPRLENVALILRFLGKGFDGSGLPDSPQRGDGLPPGSRILRALLDFGTIEARVKSMEVALEELRLQGARYDPQVLAAIASVLGLPLHSH